MTKPSNTDRLTAQEGIANRVATYRARVSQVLVRDVAQVSDAFLGGVHRGIETQPRDFSVNLSCFEIPLYCLCGAEIGSEHWDDCPRPYYGSDLIEMEKWDDAARERVQ